MTLRLGRSLLVLLTVLAGCSSEKPRATDEPSKGSSASSAAPAPVRPEGGSCHQLTFEEATDPVDAGSSVPCGRAHTAQPFKVGPIADPADGHLLAVDSPAV